MREGETKGAGGLEKKEAASRGKQGATFIEKKAAIYMQEAAVSWASADGS